MRNWELERERERERQRERGGGGRCGDTFMCPKNKRSIKISAKQLGNGESEQITADY